MIRPGKMDALHATLSPDVINDCVAMSNTMGGAIHIGYDGTEVVGVENPDQVLNKMRLMLEEHVRPKGLIDTVLFTVESDSGKSTVKALVPAMPLDVHYVASGGLERGVFIRDGSRTVLATSIQVAQMLDRTYCLYNDPSYLALHSPKLHADFSTLAQRCGSQNLAPAQKALAQKGGSLLFEDGTISNLGYLFSDQCLTQIQIYDSDGKCTEYDGPYFSQIDAIAMKLRSINLLRKDQPLPYDYPPEALTALLYHAVRYRDYALPGTIIFRATANCIEAVFPGTLVSPYTLEDYLNGGSYPKDPEMSRALEALGINVLQFADFSAIRDIYASYGLEPTYSISDHIIRVTLPNLNRSEAAEQYAPLTAKERDILDLVRLRLCITRKDIEEELHLPQATAIRTLNGLVEKGYIEKDGAGRKTVYRDLSLNGSTSF